MVCVFLMLNPTAQAAEHDSVVQMKADLSDDEIQKSSNYLKFDSSTKQKFYHLENGDVVLEKRKIGPMYPSVFDVVRSDVNGSRYYQVEDNRCDLSAIYLKTLYSQKGLQLRTFANALQRKTSACQSLASAEEIATCKEFHSNSECVGATPLISEFVAAKEKNCGEIKSLLLADTVVPRESREWWNAERNLREKKAKALKIENATTIQVDARDVDRLASERYSPASSFQSVLETPCKGMPESAQKARAFGEVFNIPVHNVLNYADYINQCWCR